MRVSNLPSPGILANGILLRREAAKAISSVEIVSSKYPGGLSGQATKLHGFFTACATAIAALRDVTAPTISAINVLNADPKIVRVRFSERMDKSVLPAASAFAFTSARTIASLDWNDAREDELVIVLTASAVGVTNVAYTQPGTNGLRDYGGNLVATDATTAITFA